MLNSYLDKIQQIHSQGDAREESFYSALEQLLLDSVRSLEIGNVRVTTLPKKTEVGNPDFRVWDGKYHITGYIEAKAPTVEYLDQVAESDQLQRYIEVFPNLILTNFFEFRLFRDGEQISSVQIAHPSILTRVKTRPPVENKEKFQEFIQRFFSFSLPKVYSAKSLATELAKRTRFLKEEVIAEELRNSTAKPSPLVGFYDAFQNYLIAGLTRDDFADLYAQTVTYGLFAARTRSENGFNRRLAFENIPRTIGILRDVFRFISLGEVPPQMEWILDDISEVLAVADVREILHDYFHEGKESDPIIHFYETFLSEYDPKERERRGVYYTPEPVVSYIVRSLDGVLKDYFKKPDGFASADVLVLDPAAGTLTFLAEAARLAVEEFSLKYGAGGRSNLIKDHILKNFHAFELMMAPYAIGHLKMSFFLEELGYRLKKDDRFKLYLTNTLEMEDLPGTTMPIAASLAEESHLAGEVKRKTPILVILGNPPYSGHSTNIGKWISKEIKDYYEVDGKPLGEKNPKWLQDDYVKFIRFAQWKIDQAGEGVLGFITNHSYLDNPTFRGMRRSLMNSFNEIYLLDLHGSSLKKEKCPDGSKDENVFDIRQGVAIMLMIKKKGLKKKISHAELWGLREKKYEWLLQNDLKKTKWKKLQPKKELYLFVSRDEKLFQSYYKFHKVTDIFPISSVGIVTARDKFVIDFDKETLRRRIRTFRDERISDDMVRRTFKLKDNRDWKMVEKRRKIIADEEWEQKIIEFYYRPFDLRWIFYHKEAIDFGRHDVMQHMIRPDNLGLIVPRRVEIHGAYHHSICTSQIIDHVALSFKTIDYLFPLYLYPPPEEKNHQHEIVCENLSAYDRKVPNLSPELVEQLRKQFGKQPTPEDIFSYIYAVLYSSVYRKKYAEFLKSDFPRVPFAPSNDLFTKLAALGNQLVDMHLLKSPELESPIARFREEGPHRVEKLRYDEREQRVYVNKAQYFDGVEKSVWEYHIGGYQVAEKWLKDRKERVLTLEEIKHYCRVITALKRTIEIQTEIDYLYPMVDEPV
jgi:hypothetical protein